MSSAILTSRIISIAAGLGKEFKEISIMETIYYRGSNPEDERRIESPFASDKLFVTPKYESAQAYGHHIEKVIIRPGAKILKEGTKEFKQIVGVFNVMYDWKKLGVDGPITGYQLAVDKAIQSGYDVVEFHRPTDIGTVVLNPEAILRREASKRRKTSMNTFKAFETLQQLREAAKKENSLKVPSLSPREFSKEEAKKVGDELGLSWDKYSLEEFHKGLNVELEHSDITRGDPKLTAKIAIAHLNEVKNYYTLLAKYVEGKENKSQS